METRKFNIEIYPENIIKQAILDYRSIANITMQQENGYVVCVFCHTKYDVKLTVREFSNYLIELMDTMVL